MPDAARNHACAFRSSHAHGSLDPTDTTNADLIASQLHAAGVRHAIGIPSGQILAIIDAMRRAGIDFVLVSHEGAAGFMADVIGRVSGVPGVAVATVGPGATNLTTGIGNAFLDRSPVLAITGQVPRPQLSRRVQMRVDHQAIFRPLTKASYQFAPGSVAATVQQALALAMAEPPGPVHLDLPEDVATAPADAGPHPAPISQVEESTARSTPDLDAILKRLKESRKPLAVLGFSLYRCGALPELLQFLEANRIPFVTTNMAKGVVPEGHPLWLGVIGRALRKTIERYLAQTDLVIGLGYDPIEISYEEWLPAAPLIHIDAEPADIDGSVRLEHQATGDLGAMLRALAQAPANGNDWDAASMSSFRDQLERGIRLPGEGFQPWQALDILRELMPEDAILACDVGAHTHLVATQWRVTVPETLLVSNGWSSMGYAIPAALGAKLAKPDRTVAAVMGDGGFLMMAGEMATAARLGLPIPFIILNDGWLALIKVKQERRQYAYSGVEVGDQPPRPPAEYFGVPNRVARTPAEFRAVVQAAFRADGPTVVEAMVRPEIYSTILYG